MLIHRIPMDKTGVLAEMNVSYVPSELSYSKFAGLAMAQTMVKPSLKTPVFKKKSSKMEERMQNEMRIDVHPHKKSHQT